MRKRILSVVLAGALSATIVAGSALTASAIKNDDDTYTPGPGITAKTYKFAMPGAWMSDYWKTAENCAGLYWWTGTDKPGDVFTHDWPGYKVKTVGEAGVENLYSSPCPADATMIIFSNHIDGGMPGTEGFLQERFDAACQIKDTGSQYYCFNDSDYQSKALWAYVWDKAADAVDMDHVNWDLTKRTDTPEEVNQYKEIYAALLELVEEEDFELEIPEFGEYGKNFYIDVENGDGIVLSFDNMVFVVNMDPNTMTVSTTIVPEGKITYGGEWMFYYGNGKYGTWPTEELLKEKTGITFDEDGNAVIPEGNTEYTKDEYDAVNFTYSGSGRDQKLMVAGNFKGNYYKKTEPVTLPPDLQPTTAVPTTTQKPASPDNPSTDPTSATKAPQGSGTPATNGANGAIATGDFAFAVIVFVVIAAGIAVFFFSRKTKRESK